MIKLTLVNDLKTICRKLEGTLVTIGLSYPTVESVLDKNTNITNGYILVFDGKKKGKNKTKTGKKQKKISIKKLRKTFKKKTVNTIICRYEDIEKYMRFFVRDSVYINCGKLYIYGKKDEFILDDIENYYKRYQTKIEITDYKEDFLIEVDNSKAKNNWIKDKIYRIKDTIVYYINVIGDIMIG